MMGFQETFRNPSKTIRYLILFTLIFIFSSQTAFAAQSSPVTHASVSPHRCIHGEWCSGDVTVTLKAAAMHHTGIKQITYSATGAKAIPEVIVTGNSVSFLINMQGITTVTFFAEDNVGHREKPKTVTVRIDKTAPVLTDPSADKELWPPDHEMKPVEISYNVTDISPTACRLKVACEEDNKTCSKGIVRDAHHVFLRADLRSR